MVPVFDLIKQQTPNTALVQEDRTDEGIHIDTQERVTLAFCFLAFKNLGPNLDKEFSGPFISSDSQGLPSPAENHLATGRALASADGPKKALESHVRQNAARESAEQGPL
jgi:hypothetical protein